MGALKLTYKANFLESKSDHRAYQQTGLRVVYKEIGTENHNFRVLCNNPFSFIDPDGGFSSESCAECPNGHKDDGIDPGYREVKGGLSAAFDNYSSFRSDHIAFEYASISNYEVRNNVKLDFNSLTGEYEISKLKSTTIWDWTTKKLDSDGFMAESTATEREIYFYQPTGTAAKSDDIFRQGGGASGIGFTTASNIVGGFSLGTLTLEKVLNYGANYSDNTPISIRQAAKEVAAGKYFRNVSRNLGRIGTGLAVLGAGATVLDGLTNQNGWQNHHTADLAIQGAIYGTALAFPVVGWIAGAVYFAADLTTQYYTGKSITQNLFNP